MREGSIGRRRVDRLAIAFIARRSSLPVCPLPFADAPFLTYDASSSKRLDTRLESHACPSFIRRCANRGESRLDSPMDLVDPFLHLTLPTPFSWYLAITGRYSRSTPAGSRQLDFHSHARAKSAESERGKPNGTDRAGRVEKYARPPRRATTKRQQPVNQHLAAFRVRQARVRCKKSAMIRARLTLAGRKSGQTPFTEVADFSLSLSLSLSLYYPDYTFTLNS